MNGMEKVNCMREILNFNIPKPCLACARGPRALFSDLQAHLSSFKTDLYVSISLFSKAHRSILCPFNIWVFFICHLLLGQDSHTYIYMFIISCDKYLWKCTMCPEWCNFQEYRDKSCAHETYSAEKTTNIF